MGATPPERAEEPWTSGRDPLFEGGVGLWGLSPGLGPSHDSAWHTDVPKVMVLLD